jgi:hypothetical protein
VGPSGEHVGVDRRPISRLADLAAENSLLVVLVSLLATVLLALAPELIVADSWMTLVAGREIVEHGLPSREWLTLLPLGEPWTDQQWLAQITFHGVETLGGLRLALLLDIALVVAAFGVAVVASRLRGASAQSTLFAASAAMIVAPWGWQLRAQSFALPLFTVVLALVALDPDVRRRRTWLVFPLLVVWANLHGSVLLGAALVSLAGVIGLVRAAARRPGPGAGRSAAFAVVPWACVLVSPYSFDLPAYYRLLLVDSPVSKVIAEWQAPEPKGWLLVFFALAAATAVLVLWQRRRLSAFDIAVLALTLAGALRATRSVTWFALAVAVLLPVALDGVLRSAPPVRRRLGLALSGTFVGLAAVMLVAVLVRPASWFTATWPDEAARVVARETRGAGARAVWPSDMHADWLLWKLPQLRGRVAYDVRFELVTDEELQSIVRYKSLTAGWEDAARGYRVVVLDPDDTPEHRERLVELGARVVYEGDDIVVLAWPSAA